MTPAWLHGVVSLAVSFVLQNLETFCHETQSIFSLTQTLCVTLYQHKDEQPVNEVTVCREEKR